MSFFPPGKPKRPRGRPIGTFNRYREKSITAIRVTQTLVEILDSEKIKGETYAETIIRLLRDRTKKISEYRKKAEALEQELMAVYHTTK
jgi:hypothetical protein